jgi:hypothetical protein
MSTIPARKIERNGNHSDRRARIGARPAHHILNGDDGYGFTGGGGT